MASIQVLMNLKKSDIFLVKLLLIYLNRKEL